MMWSIDNPISGLIAQAQVTAGDVTTTTTIEYDFPPESFADGLLLAGFAVVGALVVWLLLRDTRQLGPVQRAWLLVLRLAALAGLPGIRQVTRAPGAPEGFPEPGARSPVNAGKR